MLSTNLLRGKQSRYTIDTANHIEYPFPSFISSKIPYPVTKNFCTQTISPLMFSDNIIKAAIRQ